MNLKTRYNLKDKYFNNHLDVMKQTFIRNMKNRISKR